MELDTGAKFQLKKQKRASHKGMGLITSCSSLIFTPGTAHREKFVR